ncbi:MAG: hypothetical protein GWP06_10430 [Actinobacteria bacterium]|nr:hypothetical protein [Actinomycetota bacterium]
MSIVKNVFSAFGLFVLMLFLSCNIGRNDKNAKVLSTISFRHKIIDANPPSGNGCCLDVLSIGDIDGDGKPDVMVGSEGASGMVWYHYPSWKKYHIADGDFTTDGEIADMDGDNDGDIVISCISRDQIEWWENTGTPFDDQSWIRHVIGKKFSHDLAVGDIDNDGKTDVVVFKKGAQRQLAWFKAPEEKNAGWTHIEIGTPAGEGLDLGDIDGDGDLDIAGGRNWYENVSGDGSTWNEHIITDKWGLDCRDIIADINGDGKPDIVLSHSEGKGRVSWFENPSWTEHPIEAAEMEGVHSLEVGDFNLDGQPDIFCGQMHTSATRQVVVYENLGAGLSWKKLILANTGTHNARIGDIGADGDLDIVGKNYDGPKKVEMWENVTPKHISLSKNKWTVVQIDSKRKAQAFGLAMGDITGDGFKDIVSGEYFYRNPGGDMTKHWKRVTLPERTDAMLILNVDDDQFVDVIAQRLPDIFWLEPQDTCGEKWKALRVAGMPATSHGNGQGYVLAQIEPGGKPEILFSGGKQDREIYYFEIPSHPEKGNWPRTLVTNESTDEGIGTGDIDGDGDIDIAAGDMYTGGKKVAWWENPGNGTSGWLKHDVGVIEGTFPDRFYLADINGDDRLDMVVSEENGEANGAHVYWFEQPQNPEAKAWPRHTIVVQASTNSMDVADMDDDGDMDIITGEHRGQKRICIFENDGNGTFICHVVDHGKESHLGVRVADLDGDGDKEIVSIAWDDFKSLYLWRNDALGTYYPLQSE